MILPKKPDGFSLIELVIIISAIVALTAIGFLVIANVPRYARDAKRKTDLIILSKVLTEYYLDHTYYPPINTIYNSEWRCGLTISPWGDCALLQEELKHYVQKMPFDPQDRVVPGGNTNCRFSPCYFYGTTNPEHSDFCLCADLENPPQTPVLPKCAYLGKNYCIRSSL